MTNNEFIVSLFILFIYSQPCPFSFFIFTLLLRARKHRKARGVMLVSSTPQMRSLVTKFSKMAVFLSSVPLVFLSKSPFKLNIEIKVS